MQIFNREIQYLVDTDFIGSEIKDAGFLRTECTPLYDLEYYTLKLGQVIAIQLKSEHFLLYHTLTWVVKLVNRYVDCPSRNAMNVCWTLIRTHAEVPTRNKFIA